MMTLYAPLLAAVLLAQAQVNRPASGEVVDRQGKPVADAAVALYSPPSVFGKGDPVEARTKSDAQGKFNLKVPPLGRTLINGVNFLAYSPGRTLTAQWIARGSHRLVLEKPQPRTLKVEGPAGDGIARARITVRLIHVFGGVNAEVPSSMADPLAVTTGPDGTATLNYLAARDQLVAVRVSADSVGTQDFQLIARPGQDSEQPVITIKLKPTSRVAGRLVDQDGQPVADHVVEVWSRGDAIWLGPNTVEFRNGPLRTGADGSFQTPDNLMVGSIYRVAMREEGKDPVFSDWITMGAQPRTLPSMALRPLRTVSGRVVDRQGKPIGSIDVFQSGDGPERTAARTDADGRFSLGGLRHGSVFLFARGDGFRFHGQLVKPDERSVTVELTRRSERPTREMRMLPDPIPFEESQALARRLVEPLWETAAQDGEDSAKFSVLSHLMSVDPARVLERLESVKFQADGWKNRLQRELVLELARSDFEEATAVAESIAEPGVRAWALVHLADRLPAAKRERKLALLERALLYAKVATRQDDRLLQIGEVAERWYELGEVDKAKALFAEGLEIARRFTDKTEFTRGLFAARLARVDLPAALEIARDFDGEREQGRILGSMAFRLVEQNPPEAERIWLKSRGGGLVPMHPTLAWKMAAVDPARARQAIQKLSLAQWYPNCFLFVALGAKARDQAAVDDSFQAGVKGIDRVLREFPERYQLHAGAWLPVVERIDPALVPEVFWLDVSSRLPAGNPRALNAGSASRLITYLAWYDREVAAGLFEPTRARMEQTDAADLATWAIEFRAWALFDPRAAVARLEKLPVDSKLQNHARGARLVVAETLARPHEERWRNIWDDWDIVFGGTKRDF
ncbi:MAG: carboxypeptidase regulatory-like domain-containing protein [Isosphaeraceae bacterium]